MTLKRIDFWSIEGDFMYRYHIEPRVQLNVPKEETFPNPLKFFDVSRTTHTRSGCIEGKNLSAIFGTSMWIEFYQTGFTKFTWLTEKPPPRCLWFGERLIKIQATTRRDFLWPEIWIGMLKAATKQEKQEWFRSPKPDNARKLRGIYFVDPEENI